VKGKIYFTGVGFFNVMLIEANSGEYNLPYYLCERGNKVIFEECSFRNRDETLTLPINKSFTIRNEE